MLVTVLWLSGQPARGEKTLSSWGLRMGCKVMNGLMHSIWIMTHTIQSLGKTPGNASCVPRQEGTWRNSLFYSKTWLFNEERRKEGRFDSMKVGAEMAGTFWSFFQMPADPAYWSWVPFLDVCILLLLRAVPRLSLEDSLRMSAAECPETSQSFSTSGGRPQRVQA